MTRSEAERRLLALTRAARLPRPETNVRIGGNELDLYWPRHRLNVEMDGSAVHSTPRFIENDRRRDAEMQAAGYAVLRFTRNQLFNEPEAVIARIAATLAIRADQAA